MANRHSARLALSCALAASLYVMTTAAAPAQDVARVPLTLTSGRVALAGTSNIHAYEASTTTVRVTRVQLAGAIAGSTLWENLVKPGAIEAFEIAIAASTLTSPKEGLDKNMHKALKVTEYPDITFRLLRLEAGPAAGAFKGIGMLKIAGVEREVALSLAMSKKDSMLLVKGELPLLMTDYGIAPPKAMLGMLKTDPKVTITFETTFAVPTT